MRITKWGECGILCCAQLARHAGQSIGAPEIAESQGLDPQYTQQVLQRLRKGGIITSARGPKGGFRLARDAKAISLREILYAAEGDTFEIICDASPLHPDPARPSHCSTGEFCSLQQVWRDLKVAIDLLLEQRSLDSLIQTSGLVELGGSRRRDVKR